MRKNGQGYKDPKQVGRHLPTQRYVQAYIKYPKKKRFRFVYIITSNLYIFVKYFFIYIYGYIFQIKKNMNKLNTHFCHFIYIYILYIAVISMKYNISIINLYKLCTGYI